MAATSPVTNWTTTNPWEDGTWRRAIELLVGSREAGTIRENASALASNFLTCANTAARHLKRSRWIGKPRWALRTLDAYVLAHEFSVLIFRDAIGLDGKVDRYVRNPLHPYRMRIKPQALADQLDVALSVLLKSPLPRDVKRAKLLAKLGLSLVEQCGRYRVALALHTKGLLYCGAAKAALRADERRDAEVNLARASAVVNRLLAMLGEDLLSPPTVVFPSQFQFARQTARILRKMGEVAKGLDGEALGARYETFATHLFKLTDTKNQLI